MTREEYMEKLHHQLDEWERKLDDMRQRSSQKLDMRSILEDWKTRRDAAMAKYEELKGETGDRWDVLKMGVESAWAELRTAFETATSTEPQGTAAEAKREREKSEKGEQSERSEKREKREKKGKAA